MTEPEFDDEIIQVYKVFDRDDKGINERELMDVMNKLLELKYIHNQRTQGNAGKQEAGAEEEEQDEDNLSMDAEDRIGGETAGGDKKPYLQISLEEAKDMIGEDCTSFIQAHNSVSQLYNTVLQLTSEEGFRAIQNKALAHLKEQQAFA